MPTDNVTAPDSFVLCCQVLFSAFLQAIMLCILGFPSYRRGEVKVYFSKLK
jgi:hypothetical protein